MPYDYEIPYYWVHVGPPDMPEPGFYEDPMSMLGDGPVPMLENMWRNVGYNMSGECARVLSDLKRPTSILLCLDTFRESVETKPGIEVALLIRGHAGAQNRNNRDECIRQLYIPKAKCLEVQRPHPEKWQDEGSAPYDAILSFETDFRSLRYLDSEGESDSWDKQIEEDGMSGKLDALSDKSMANFESGRYTEL